MSDSADPAQLSEREVTLVLQHLAGELPATGERVNAVADTDGATAVLQAFVAEAERQGISAGEPPAAGSGRAAIELALSDEQTRELAEELVADPPQDDQMGIVELAPHLAALGFFVTFLQTRFSVSISRSDGKTKVKVEFGKEALPVEQIAKLLSIAQSLLPGDRAQ
jgi:hypothetical protein